MSDWFGPTGMSVTKALQQDKESFGSDTSHEEKRFPFRGRCGLSLCSTSHQWEMRENPH
ncbi:hypothetical protein [Bacillus chungangensis]|uniref:hypothetical protein n=1 Tax=Bacillus chungangensis TaxID=587633 RepID=UPI0027D7D31E|nr:hypothetical protein [Bacillus chungangensis]